MNNNKVVFQGAFHQESPCVKNDNLLEIASLQVAYSGRTALKDISFTVSNKEIVAIVGQSGSGKSTLLKTIMNCLPLEATITAGTVTFKNHSLLNNQKVVKTLWGNEISVMFQQPGHYFSSNKTIGVHYRDFLKAHGIKETEWYELSLQNLTAAGLPDSDKILDSYIFELSGGMQQKLAFAMSTALKPSLLLLDEPTGAMDSYSTQNFIAELEALYKANTMSILCITHNIALASTIADRLIIMREGRIVEQGEATNIMKAPVSAYTKQLIEAIPKLQ